ncbi:hypothetical protein P152DRAFT_395894 [Eremomyces bilateralis CBS 781.70]|uniref:Mitochondrial adapter protein MCP1 transmembrane domain-containing protein n=1 Tax=Eremomyces bilateralis CBS 781.70 TaxID=1392243 RepID=A0A6G1G4E5_9PEZI|nr:uncharacterized protein P152DRAFT_395894 [Eremomyces bilateralis CBS 781.70]KAF1812862.1 hypothetical protein P152DRAFT_395894 [Eremomyces bilateralis CBS 781.70]
MAEEGPAAAGIDGLRELEPSPVESPSKEKKDAPLVETRQTPAHLHPSRLGLNGNHGPSYYLSRLQRYSSYTFTVFAALHFTNTALIPLAASSLSSADSYLLLTRPYYQSPLAEPLLVALPLATHIAAGLALRLVRRAQNLRRYGAARSDDAGWCARLAQGWPPLNGISILGYALVPMVAGHAFLNRGLPWIHDGGSSNVGLEYVAHGFAKHPVVSFVGFAGLVGVAAWHFTWGWARWLGWSPSGVAPGVVEYRARRKRRWYLVNAVSVVVAGVWMAGGLGVVGRGGAATGWVGRQFDDLYSKVPIVGKWL